MYFLKLQNFYVKHFSLETTFLKLIIRHALFCQPYKQNIHFYTTTIHIQISIYAHASNLYVYIRGGKSMETLENLEKYKFYKKMF